MINRNYLNQITLIESECEPRKKQPMIGNYTKSPLRDRENKMNVANTPNRIATKASLSPLRSRRNDSTLASRAESSLMARSNMSRKREVMCINDPHKTAKYLAYSEEESLYYCEKCAILLASQGFTVMKLNSTEGSIDFNPRKEEVDSFLADLQGTMNALSKKVQAVGTQLGNATQTLREEEAKVEEYYGHFYEIIDEHKRRVLEELKEEYECAARGANESKTRLEGALVDSKRMKEDILDSMNIILNESREDQFRPIMDNYQSNARDYRTLAANTPADPLPLRRLDFRDPEAACKALQQGLQMAWGQRGMQYSKQSEGPENPVEVIETDEKFTKSSLKEIGNLFSSFDQ